MTPVKTRRLYTKKLKDNWRHITCVSVSSSGTAYCPGSPLYAAFYWAHSFLYGCDDEKPLWAQVLTWGVFQLVTTNTNICCDVEKQLCIWAQAQLDTEAKTWTKSHVIGKDRGEKTDVDQGGKCLMSRLWKRLPCGGWNDVSNMFSPWSASVLFFTTSWHYIHSSVAFFFFFGITRSKRASSNSWPRISLNSDVLPVLPSAVMLLNQCRNRWMVTDHCLITHPWHPDTCIFPKLHGGFRLNSTCPFNHSSVSVRQTAK